MFSQSLENNGMSQHISASSFFLFLFFFFFCDADLKNFSWCKVIQQIKKVSPNQIRLDFFLPKEHNINLSVWSNTMHTMVCMTSVSSCNLESLLQFVNFPNKLSLQCSAVTVWLENNDFPINCVKTWFIMTGWFTWWASRIIFKMSFSFNAPTQAESLKFKQCQLMKCSSSVLSLERDVYIFNFIDAVENALCKWIPKARCC